MKTDKGVGERRIVNIQKVSVTLNSPLCQFADRALLEAHYQTLFEFIQDEVVQELVTYGIPDEHLSVLSSRLTKAMMNVALLHGRLK